MSLNEVGRQFRVVLDTIDNLRRTIATLIASLTADVRRLHLLTQGSRHPLVSRILAARQSAINRLTEADEALAASHTSLTSYLHSIGLSPTTSGSTAPVVASTAGVPAFVQEMAQRLEVPRGAKVAGLLCMPDGTPLRDQPLVNGARGAAVNNRATLSGSWKFLDVALTHVEGHTAGIMREPGGPKRAVLVVSREPCPGELGCRKLLPGMLPKDAELTIYVAENGQARYFGTYRGTGAGAVT